MIRIDLGVLRVRPRTIAAALLFGLVMLAAPLRAADVDVATGVVSYFASNTPLANDLGHAHEGFGAHIVLIGQDRGDDVDRA